MRSSTVYTTLPDQIDYIWVTHLPNFEIQKFKVLEVTLDKDINIKLENSNIYNDTIKIRLQNKDRGLYQMKRCYHLTESEAAIRLRNHFREIQKADIPLGKQLSKENISHSIERIIIDADSPEIFINNYNKFIENYPELTV